MTDPQDLITQRQGLESLLESQRQRIRRRFLIHGMGWLLAAGSAGVLAYYLLDRSLALPSWVRILLSAVCLFYLGLGIARRLIYPIKRSLDQEDVALAIERRFPELHERLISALQLGKDLAGARLRNQSPAMIEMLVAEAAAETPQLPVEQLLDRNKTFKVWGLASGLCAIIITGLACYPDHGRAFALRILGISAQYPRNTHLQLVLPESSEDFRVERINAGEVSIIMAAGGDLHIGVAVQGLIPSEITLVISGGRGLPGEVGMTDRGAGYFRHVFRRMHKDFSFHARGGDDPHGDALVHVTTVTPPQVRRIRTELSYPPYTQREPKVMTGGAIEALIGTRVKISVAMTSEVAEAKLLLLNSGAEYQLKKVRVTDDAGTETVFVGEFLVTERDRYRIEMQSPSGLRNPYPGTYPISAIKDHAPIGRLLIPTADDINVVLRGAVLPIRLEASDDYGLTKVSAKVQTSRSESQQEFDLLGNPNQNRSNPLGPVRQEHRILTRLLEVSEIGEGDAGTAIGESISVEIELTDNRQPEALTTSLPPRQVHVVAETDLARRIAGHFRRIREDVDGALSLQRDRHARLLDTIDELQQGTSPNALGSMLIAIEVGQGRVLGATQRIHREFMRSFNVHLFNRLDQSIHAAKVLEMYLAYHSQNEDRAPFLPDFYRSVERERRQGSLGAMEKTLDPILRMTNHADRIANQLADSALRSMEGAGVAADRAKLEQRLQTAGGLQAQIIQELETLFSLLGEWNEFQDVISNTRALRDKQREVRDRTDAMTGGRK